MLLDATARGVVSAWDCPGLSGGSNSLSPMTVVSSVNSGELTASEQPPRRRPALSPSRAGDFKQCPLLYRLRVVDRVPEAPSPIMVRGTVVHAVLERLFALPAGERVPARAQELLEPAWADLQAAEPELAAMFDGAEPGHAAAWLESARELLESYFVLEDPSRICPEACELLVEAELEPSEDGGDPVLLRGYIDRLDVARTGEIRVVDYKTGMAPREVGEARALFQMKFYAVVLWRTRGVVPRQLRLIYLADRQLLSYTPDEAELRRFERTLGAIWAAILKAGRTGDFRPHRSRMCDYCSHHALCPEFGGTPPPYPGWPADPDAAAETPLDRAE
jgi:putative RecB family exonuclease